MATDFKWDDLTTSGNWNSAKLYADAKIMAHMINFDTLIEIAKFGTADILEDFILDEQTKTKARIQAIRRLATKIKILLMNTKFALKSVESKTAFEKYLNVIKIIENKYLSKNVIYTEKKSINKISATIINEEMFNKVLEMMESIMMDMLEPLNRAELIFRSYPDEDPDVIKQKIMQDIVNSG